MYFNLSSLKPTLPLLTYSSFDCTALSKGIGLETKEGKKRAGGKKYKGDGGGKVYSHARTHAYKATKQASKQASI